MISTRLILLSLAIMGLITTTQAGWLKQVCDRNCTQSKCQSDPLMKRKCKENCQNAPEVLNVCKSTISLPDALPKPALQPSISSNQQAKSGLLFPRGSYHKYPLKKNRCYLKRPNSRTNHPLP